MSKYDVYMTETLLIKYTVKSSSVDSAKDLIHSGDYDTSDFEIVDSLNCEIDSIELKTE